MSCAYPYKPDGMVYPDWLHADTQHVYPWTMEGNTSNIDHGYHMPLMGPFIKSWREVPIRPVSEMKWNEYLIQPTEWRTRHWPTLGIRFLLVGRVTGFLKWSMYVLISGLYVNDGGRGAIL